MAAWVLSVIQDLSASVMLTRYLNRKYSTIKAVLFLSCVEPYLQSENVHRSYIQKNMHLMSLQRMQERYCMIHVWKILSQLAQNDIGDLGWG